MPPSSFITARMKLAMMQRAERYGEFVAHLTSQCTGLRNSNVVRVTRTVAAHNASPGCHKSKMLFVPMTFGFP